MHTRMCTPGEGTESDNSDAEVGITLDTIQAGVAVLLEWDADVDEPEALVWAICKAVPP